MNGGIRCAADVLKAVALGADAVLLGRPYAYALAVGGQRGVEVLIENMMAEVDLPLARMGASPVRDLDRSWVDTVAGPRRRPERARAHRARGDGRRRARARRGA